MRFRKFGFKAIIPQDDKKIKEIEEKENVQYA